MCFLFFLSLFRRIVSITLEDIKLYMNKTRKDSSFKGAIGRSLTRTLYANQKNPENERNTICNDVVLTIAVVMLLQKDSHLLDAMNEKIEILNSLIDFWRFRNDKTHRDSEKQPKLLTIEQCLGCFYFCILGILVAFFVFCFEIFYKLIYNKHILLIILYLTEPTFHSIPTQQTFSHSKH